MYLSFLAFYKSPQKDTLQSMIWEPIIVLHKNIFRKSRIVAGYNFSAIYNKLLKYEWKGWGNIQTWIIQTKIIYPGTI